MILLAVLKQQGAVTCLEQALQRRTCCFRQWLSRLVPVAELGCIDADEAQAAAIVQFDGIPVIDIDDLYALTGFSLPGMRLPSAGRGLPARAWML